MKGIKCFGILSLFFITVFALLNVSLDVSALKHDYDTMPIFKVELPYGLTYNSQTSRYEADFNASNSGGTSTLGSPFKIEFEGDSWQTSYEDLSLALPSSYMTTSTLDNEKQYSNLYSVFQESLIGNGSHSNSFNTDRFSIYSPSYYNLSDSMSSHSLYAFGSNNIPPFDTDTLPSGLLSCSPFVNGAVCGGLWNTSEYIRSNILPYHYSYDAMYFASHAIDADSGLRYSQAGTLSKLFNQYIPSFSHLDIPLHDYSDYWYNPDNFYSGRQLDFKGVFEFDGSFAWHSNISNNGSYFRLYYQVARSSEAFGLEENYVDCSTNLITLSSTTQLEYSCSITLSDNYSYFYPYLSIDGNGNYVWLTDNDWYFASVFVVTDNDDTSGEHFGTSYINGGGAIPGDAVNNIPSGDADWFNSLVNLFNFNFANPFAPLFSMFTNNDSCASIPTIAGMIHSEETTVCPWFNSTTRNIVTPVLSIASIMLVFGFVVRWLGSSSGNFFEDSKNEEVSNQGGKWGHFKRGGQ